MINRNLLSILKMQHCKYPDRISLNEMVFQILSFRKKLVSRSRFRNKFPAE